MGWASVLGNDLVSTNLPVTGRRRYDTIRNCVIVYLLFSRYISCSNFWHVSSIHVLAIDFRRGRAHSSVRSIAPHTLHTVCGVSIECLEWIVLYIPFHSRHSTKDRSLGVGRDIT